MVILVVHEPNKQTSVSSKSSKQTNANFVIDLRQGSATLARDRLGQLWRRHSHQRLPEGEAAATDEEVEVKGTNEEALHHRDFLCRRARA